MKLHFYFLFIFYTLFFLFYAGDSSYFHIFAYNRQIFSQTEKKIDLKINPVPYLKYQYYPEVSAEGIYVVNLPSFTPIFEKNPRQKFLPASTAKIITALVAFDIYQLDDILTVKRVVNEGQIMGLVVNEKITLENLLYGILVHSANDAAYVLADNFGYQKFIYLMNQKAHQLQMKDSHFSNPAGFDENNQQITPFDLTLAARELLKNKYLRKIVATKEIIISDIDYKYFHKLSNINKLLGEVQGIGGLKTGYTQEAGENLVSFYKNPSLVKNLDNKNDFIIVILKSKDRFQDTRNIVKWINENIDYINYSLK